MNAPCVQLRRMARCDHMALGVVQTASQSLCTPFPRHQRVLYAPALVRTSFVPAGGQGQIEAVSKLFMHIIAIKLTTHLNTLRTKHCRYKHAGLCPAVSLDASSIP